MTLDVTNLTQTQQDALAEAMEIAKQGPPKGGPVGLDLGWLLTLLTPLSIVFPQIAPFIPILNLVLSFNYKPAVGLLNEIFKLLGINVVIPSFTPASGATL